MVEIRPFCGYRYNPDKVKDISGAIAPPWDVIDSHMEKHLKEISPVNIINLISKNCKPEDVKQKFDEWIENGILIRDMKEGFYFMKHRFIWMEREFIRKGFFTLLRLEDFSTGNVIPHERIFEKYSTNRYQLIQKCRANFSPVLMLYQDNSFAVEKIIGKSSVITEGHTLDKEKFEFGRIAEGDDIECIKETVSKGTLIIADGHHRYSAALQYYKDNPSPENRFVLVFLININSPEVLILPTHRYIPYDISFINCLDIFRRYFHITEVPDLKTMYEMQNSEKNNTFGVYENNRFYIIELKDINDIKQYLSDRFSDRWIALDTVLLHEFILPHIFDSQPQEVIYHQSPEYLLEEYKKRNSGVIFFLKAVNKQHFLDICFNGELMPQKTTYFYPKVPSGLVIYKFDR
ncbi:MAG TPA: DUF1015 domain-containing protein [bacterium]|nr:DUF1015 domain-containing protein [bacterium]HPP29431.1 DUF1015 domain-containing protein [bacterium]